jgi:hypothetical protein
MLSKNGTPASNGSGGIHGGDLLQKYLSGSLLFG